MPTPGTTTPKKGGMTREAFVEEVFERRRGILDWLRCQWPRLGESDYEDIFQSAVVRCLEGERYRKFNPDPDRELGAFWTWFVWNRVPAKSPHKGPPVQSCGNNYRRSLWRQRRTIWAYWPWFEATTGARLVYRKEDGRLVDTDIAIPDTFVEDTLRREWVQKGLSRLGEKDRRAIHAYFWEELRGAELAEALSVSEDHAKKPVKRAIERLRQILLELGGDQPQPRGYLQNAA
jgi:RNA polymerase sigma factor (sigma-70 family)